MLWAPGWCSGVNSPGAEKHRPPKGEHISLLPGLVNSRSRAGWLPSLRQKPRCHAGAATPSRGGWPFPRGNGLPHALRCEPRSRAGTATPSRPGEGATTQQPSPHRLSLREKAVPSHRRSLFGRIRSFAASVLFRCPGGLRHGGRKFARRFLFTYLIDRLAADKEVGGDIFK